MFLNRHLIRELILVVQVNDESVSRDGLTSARRRPTRRRRIVLPLHSQRCRDRSPCHSSGPDGSDGAVSNRDGGRTAAVSGLRTGLSRRDLLRTGAAGRRRRLLRRGRRRRTRLRLSGGGSGGGVLLAGSAFKRRRIDASRTEG
jgi:hypothetical protein